MVIFAKSSEKLVKCTGESVEIGGNQPTGTRNQPKKENISQPGQGISQRKKISANRGKESAKVENISQPGQGISQSKRISANRSRKSAKVRKYQPTGARNQPK